ncbi:hypothetical protein P3S20_21820, partial [Enterobacter hormaechei]|nr:hypothetical protein [Enterobacter hormaechei subsp. xiangfangensis]MDF3577615.1 hypothetical protein [Enterobacter hormaechei]MDF3587228.1 hypothetical protein [Enterobacter hormaechei]
MKMTKPKPVSRMKRPFISELAELGLSGEILSIRTDGMQGTLIPDLTAGVSEAGRVKTGNWVISDKRTFDHVVLCGVVSENGIYGHSRFCNTDFDDKLACLNLSG